MGYYPSSTIRETLTIPCSQDAWTDESNPTVNHGLDSIIQNGGSNNANSRNALFKFDVSPIPFGVTIVRARLRLYCEIEFVNKGGTYRLRSLLTDWTESGVTHESTGFGSWSGGDINAPDNYDSDPVLEYANHSHVDGGGSPNPYYTQGQWPYGDDWTGRWIEFDISQLVREWLIGFTDNHGIVITSLSKVPDPDDVIDQNYGYMNLSWHSRENVNPPELVVTYMRSPDAGSSLPQLPDDNLFVGEGGSVNTKLIRMPKYADLFVVFEPVFTISDNGGDFNDTFIVEKGYVIPTAGLAWSSDANFPLTDSDQLTLDGGAIILDGTPPVPNLVGGDYSHPGGLDEVDHGSGFSVRLHSGAEQVVKTAAFAWRWRRHWLVDSTETPDTTWLQAIAGSTTPPGGSELATGHDTTKSFNAAAQYIYFIFHAVHGIPSQFIVSGLPTTFQRFDISGVVNRYGAGVGDTWHVFRSLNLQNGSGITVEVN